MKKRTKGFVCPLIEKKTRNHDIGKYGHLWMRYIKKEYPKRYASLVRFGELESKAIEVNGVACELFEELEREWMQCHKTQNITSITERRQLKNVARMIAEEAVIHDVVKCYH